MRSLLLLLAYALLFSFTATSSAFAEDKLSIEEEILLELDLEELFPSQSIFPACYQVGPDRLVCCFGSKCWAVENRPAYA